MTRDEILRLLATNRDKLKELKVKRLALFGSVARGDDCPDSDVDILVEFEDEFNLRIYSNLLFYLQELLERKVDLVLRDGLKPRVIPHVEKEIIYVT